MGLRIKGGESRGLNNKSFNLYARKKYSGYSKLKYNLFEDNKNFVDGKTIEMYDSFGLRSIKVPIHHHEIIIQEAIKDLDSLATYNMKSCMLFLDGEFWGMYEIMEKSFDYFFESNYGVPKEEIAQMKNYITEEGEDKDFDEFKQFHMTSWTSKTVLTSEDYEYISSIVDIDSIIFHYSIGVYIGVWDWPNFNLMVWKYKGEKIEGNIYSDGKYRFGSFDFDLTIGQPNVFGGDVFSYDFWNHFNERKNGYPTTIFYGLFKNEEFKKYFIEKFKYVADEVFSPEKMNKILDEREKYLDYIILNEWRWKNYTPRETYESYITYEGNVIKEEFSKIREFFNKRKEYALAQTLNYFGIQQ